MKTTKRRQQSVTWVVPALGLGALAACSQAPAPTTSFLRGTMAAATFPAAVKQIAVRGADGSESRVAPDPNGGFRLALEQGTSYHFLCETAAGSVPLVLAGSHGRYITELAVRSGGAEANLGLVRYFEGTASGLDGAASRPRSIVLHPAAPVTPGDECIDGYFSGSAEPCMSQQANAICSEGGDDDEHQCEDGLDPNGKPCDGGPAANADDEQEAEGAKSQEKDDDGIECEDGLDPNGNPCDDDKGDKEEKDEQGEAQMSGPVAVPELSLAGLLGCDDDDGDKDEEVEEEGEN
ncbi:MAG: hypothetical protein HY744_02685 [Deltaproteobacteria bacterium]|nr:hypothetical protein [Deltaproteobacteria bacterium]